MRRGYRPGNLPREGPVTGKGDPDAFSLLWNNSLHVSRYILINVLARLSSELSPSDFAITCRQFYSVTGFMHPHRDTINTDRCRGTRHLHEDIIRTIWASNAAII